MENTGLNITQNSIIDVLQGSIDAGKHGIIHNEDNILNIKSFMSEDGKSSKTIIVCEVEEEKEIMYILYSKISIKLMDICIFINDELYLDREKLILYLIPENILYNNANLIWIRDDNDNIKLYNFNHDNIHMIIRDGIFTLSNIKEITVDKIKDKIFINLGKEYLEQFLDIPFTVFSTSTEKNIKYLGKNVTYKLYTDYLYGYKYEAQIGKLLCGFYNIVNNYKEMDSGKRGSIIKKLTENKQIDNFKEIILTGEPKSDNFDTYESKIIFGQI